ncbi:succinate dehydrogenase assembly factor 3, mitochondrial [Phyllopteryx taeniolatus]|uniref:succinate dehydrogenase assembly factor 3, mitochondrial n=1 Tax=Phycodurus eques TaxID=693459 RepID=UPI002ACEEE83|nr:succinate dehydrogenase assembly factor 3, mitochondrial [Phycodurus eques]XP_061648782.1 succinate dehydrogenase assembly factor 3, mitochondrial [Phyllopteryx taeniolatus]XP_061648783.1 succinate dehydrogenase assembly factor 3, mitochondrial [Phyllopteryx taeniolatus]
MASGAQVSKVCSLYKRILVLHRFLPIHLKALGDNYVKSEFRRHKNISPEETKSFMKEWENYKDTLQSQVLDSVRDKHGYLKFGIDMAEEKLSDFQDEQIGQLYELLLESTKPNRQFNIGEDSK